MLLILAGVETNSGPILQTGVSTPYKRSDNIVIGCLNVRSSVNKAAEIHALIYEQGLDVLAMCEMFMKPDTPDSVLHSVAPSGFTAIHSPRGDGRKGGGLAFVHRNILHATPLHVGTIPTCFELLAIRLDLKSHSVTLVNIYRPPQSQRDVFYARVV